MKKVQTGLRLPVEVNENAAQAAARLGISKNDFILLAIQEKLRRDGKSRR